MLGYHDEPEQSALTIEPDGWLHTGDLAVMDERGYIAVNGRIRDMVIRGGENIYPREIEDALYRHEAIAGVAVIGVPDDYYGEVLAAFVKLRDGQQATADDLTEFLRPILSGYKLPTFWRFVSEYPQTLSGKVQKFVLRDQWVRGVHTLEDSAAPFRSS
jgi:acyl-CoA synthetase (AMP-forming)/AMP-acid ligase II